MGVPSQPARSLARPGVPLLGPAAMLLSFDVDADAIVAHDDWHTHEHMAERLSIPGFLRGTRWTSTGGSPGYLVLYEVADLATLTSGRYLERLNDPTAWTRRTMPHVRNMARGLCAVSASQGLGLGTFAAVFRFAPPPDGEHALRHWLAEDVLPRLGTLPGLGSAHLLESAARPAMTLEQSIRGADAGFDWALIVTGYDPQALVDLPDVGIAQLTVRGATQVQQGAFRMGYLVTREDAVRAAHG
jgi:hypothetical protein